MGKTGSHPYAIFASVCLLGFSTTTRKVDMGQAVASGVASGPSGHRGQPLNFQMGSCTEAAIVNSSACNYILMNSYAVLLILTPRR